MGAGRTRPCAGPAMVQIGTEGGFLPARWCSPTRPSATIWTSAASPGNMKEHTLLLAPAERADVVVDFSQVPDGAKLILYNDAPPPAPAGDTRLDYYTGDPDRTATGGAPRRSRATAPTPGRSCSSRFARGRARPHPTISPRCRTRPDRRYPPPSPPPRTRRWCRKPRTGRAYGTHLCATRTPISRTTA